MFETRQDMSFFLLSCCIMFPSRGMQQSACVDGGPPDRSVLGVYVQQVAILPIFSHTFIPGLSRASTTSLPLHFHHSNRRNTVIESADMPARTNGAFYYQRHR